MVEEKNNPAIQKDRKRIRNFWIRTAVFSVIVLVILGYTAYVLTPKYDYGICSMLNLYQQPADSVDVLAIGTSQTYGGINTNILWEEYGIASYNLTTAEQAYWVGYYYLVEALKTQSPSLVLLDTKASAYPDDVNNSGRVVMGTFGILSPASRIGAIRQCTLGEDVLSYLLAFPRIHDYVREVEGSSFLIPPDNGGRGSDWKGYIEQDETERHERPSFVWTNTKMAINSHEVEYFEKILDLCEERGIPVLLISFPYPDYPSDHMYVNSLFRIAEEHGVTGINYNDPSLRFGLRYSSHFADWQHLNVKGSANFSSKLGEDIKALYDIPDRRGDDHYSSYDTCADTWFAGYPGYRPETVADRSDS